MKNNGKKTVPKKRYFLHISSTLMNWRSTELNWFASLANIPKQRATPIRELRRSPLRQHQVCALKYTRKNKATEKHANA
jgi:hypothetical protein